MAKALTAPISTGKLAGKWRVQYILEDTTGVKKRISRVFPTTARGESLDPKTLRDRVSRYKKYAASRWAGIPLTKINPMVVRNFYQKLKDDEVGEQTRIALKAGLVRVSNQAITPCRRVPHFWSNPLCLDMPTPARREAVALTPDEAKKALASKKLDDSRRAMLGVFLLAGLRLGEQMALTRGRLRLEEGLILIDRAVKLDEKSSQSVGPPKGDKVRTAVMCDTLKRPLETAVKGLGDDDLIWAQAS